MHTGVAVVGVGFDRITSLCELQLRLWDDLVECESTATEDFAGIAMAMTKLDWKLKIMDEIIPENVLLLVWGELHGPGGGATMALSVVGSHSCGSLVNN